jgi:hypothetical protein
MASAAIKTGDVVIDRAKVINVASICFCIFDILAEEKFIDIYSTGHGIPHIMSGIRCSA